MPANQIYGVMGASMLPHHSDWVLCRNRINCIPVGGWKTAALAAGIVAYLQKPVSMDLISTIEKFI